MLGISFSTSAILAMLGCLLIAWDISREKKNPWRVMSGLAILGLSVFSRLFSSYGLFSLASGFFADLGLGLMTAAAFLFIRKSKAQPFFVLSVLALVLAAGFAFLGKMLGASAESFLIELGPDDRIEEVQPVLASYDIRVERAFPEVSLAMDENLAQVYLAYGRPGAMKRAMEALRADEENVDYVAWNETVGIVPILDSERPPAGTRNDLLENDPLAASQWALDAIHAHEAHALLQDTQPVRKARVAILDTGVDGNHEDIEEIFEDSPGKTDKHGHGTHCAGIAGAATNNALGIASLNWDGAFVEVTGYRALGDTGMGTLEQIAQAIIDATNDGADVLSMSLGGFSLTPPKVVVDAVKYALKHNVIVVAAAGNSNQDARNHMPSNIDGVIAVAAVDAQGRKASFSNTNTSLKQPIAAPGVDVLSLVPGNEYAPKSGTSMATPVVSGLLGVMRALDPDLPAADAYRILHDTGETTADVDKVGRLINAHAALEAVAGKAM